MNYEKIYISLIQKRLQNKIDRSEYYCEYHHIKPRSIYPELINESTNIVALTAKEHYVAHHLLMHWYKLLYGLHHVNYYKMLLAFQYTANITANNEKFITARQYEYIKNERAKNGSNRLTIDIDLDPTSSNCPFTGSDKLVSLKFHDCREQLKRDGYKSSLFF